MGYNPAVYRHALDQRAFDVLNTFPKFVKLCETYTANYQEIASKIGLMSNCIRLNENQLPEIYKLLPPICEKLGIPVPDLYYMKSKEMNACTGGTTIPYVLVTSKLVEELSLEQLSSVIAHECGHIACKHTLYRSIAAYLIEGIDNSPLGQIPAIRKLLTPNMVKALLFWDRCSELSADRAAVLCDGDSKTFVDAILKIHGFDENINRDEFVKQALDLRAFVNDSKSTKAIEAMLVQGESHPRIATRVYECYEWTKTEEYQLIRAGKYDEPKEDIKEEHEVVVAEVSIQAEDKKLGSVTLPSDFDVDAELERINKELERYTNKVEKIDYAWAVVSGLYAGVIDALFVGQCSYGTEGIGLNHQQMNNFIQEYAKARGLRSDRLKDAIGDLEQAFKVAQDNVWKGRGIGVSAVDHHLADLAHHPTPVGLMSSLIVQFLRVGTFVNDKGEWHFVPVKTSLEDIKHVLVPAVITGILNWIAALAEKTYEDETGNEIPKGLHHLIHIAASTPIIIEVAKCADNWFGHLVSDMGGSKNTAGGGMGIPGVFVSLLYELSSLPVLKDSGLPGFVDDLYQNKKLDLRHELTIYKNLGKQAIPVVFN
ncbi:MAG: M48 family metallopeptidase, partial [Eubacterium sp.]|nr:M48 family metallopeptidase [Eubacterium sp.]